MPSTFTKLPLSSGTGSFLEDGHKDSIIEVVQKETGGLALSPENERENPITLANVYAAAGSPPGLDRDRTEVQHLGSASSALLWRLYYSNDDYYNLGTLGDSASGGTLLGSFDQTPEMVQHQFPALLKRYVQKLGGPGILQNIPVYYRIFLDNIKPEAFPKWRVKAETTDWNANVAGDIAVRRGTIHNINGNLFEFNGVASLRRREASLYEVTYEWILDPGTRALNVSSDQPDSNNQLILPGVVPSGDDALTTPGSAPNFTGDTYIRLPYHAVTHGTPEDPGDPPPFVQFQTATFDTSKYLDWQLLPGDPVNQT